MFSFYFVLFGASSTDVLANYLSISLNVVLTSFRYLAIIVPLIVYPVTYQICKELQRVPDGRPAKAGQCHPALARGRLLHHCHRTRPGDVVAEAGPVCRSTKTSSSSR